jgi:hypothetical protein
VGDQTRSKSTAIKFELPRGVMGSDLTTACRANLSRLCGLSVPRQPVAPLGLRLRLCLRSNVCTVGIQRCKCAKHKFEVCEKI